MIISSRDDETHWSRHFKRVSVFVDGDLVYDIVEAKEGKDGYVICFKTDDSGFVSVSGDGFKTFKVTGHVQFVGRSPRQSVVAL